MNKIQNATKQLKQMDKRCCTFLDEAAVLWMEDDMHRKKTKNNLLR